MMKRAQNTSATNFTVVSQFGGVFQPLWPTRSATPAEHRQSVRQTEIVPPEVLYEISKRYFSEKESEINKGVTVAGLCEPQMRATDSKMQIPSARPTGLTMSSELPIFLAAEEAASLLRTTRTAIYAMVARGQLPGVTRLGRRVLFRTQDLLDWLDQNRVPSPKE